MAWDMTLSTFLVRLVPPLRGLGLFLDRLPTASAVGYVLSSLTGLAREWRSFCANLRPPRKTIFNVGAFFSDLLTFPEQLKTRQSERYFWDFAPGGSMPKSQT